MPLRGCTSVSHGHCSPCPKVSLISFASDLLHTSSTFRSEQVRHSPVLGWETQGYLFLSPHRLPPTPLSLIPGPSLTHSLSPAPPALTWVTGKACWPLLLSCRLTVRAAREGFSNVTHHVSHYSDHHVLPVAVPCQK